MYISLTKIDFSLSKIFAFSAFINLIHILSFINICLGREVKEVKAVTIVKSIKTLENENPR